MKRVIIQTLLFLVLTSVLHFAGVYFGIYDYQIQQGNVWFDNILHALTGAIFAYAWMKIRKKKRLKVSFLNTVVFVFILAVIWEFLEASFLFLSPSYALELKMYSPSIWEAFEDITSNTVGVLVPFFFISFLSLLFNLPWTLIGLVFSLLSIPQKVSSSQNPKAIIFSVKSFWWYFWLPGMKGVRAMAIGNVVLLGQNILDKDLEHELIHVEQFNREPFVHPFLYWYESLRYGYKNNKYEREAYEKAGNVYKS